MPTALALGSFDGLHDGHRRVIAAVTGNSLGIPTVVSFWPHPREVLYGESRLRLDLPSEKTSLLEPLGVRQLVLIPFNLELASLTSEDFVESMLIRTLNARHISVGENFRFGKKREGNALRLQELASKRGVIVTIVPILKDIEGRMSSSRIRSALRDGNLSIAKQLMGRPYRFKGKVVSGKGIGKEIGWPTANLQVDGRKFLPGIGVYASRAWVENKSNAYDAVMNLGPQPTISPTSPSAVEVHLLDENIDLRECELTIEPVKRLRGQHRFANLKELSSQIALDAQMARSTLKCL